MHSISGASLKNSVRAISVSPARTNRITRMGYFFAIMYLTKPAYERRKRPDRNYSGNVRGWEESS